MNRLLKIILGAVIVIAGLIIIIAVLAVMFFPGERIKAIIERQASTALEMPVSIGSVGLSLTGIPAVKVTGITVGPVQQGEQPLFSVRTVKARVDIVALLKKKIEVVSVEINEPKIKLLTRKDGSTNLPQTHEKTEEEKTGPPELPFPVSVQSFSLKNGLIEIDNRKTGLFISLEDLSYQLSASISEDLKKLDAVGDLRVKNVSLFTGEEKNVLIEELKIRFVHALSGDLTTGDISLLTVDNLTMNTGVSDISIKGKMTGYAALVWPKEGVNADFKGHISSKKLDLNDMLITTEQKKEVSTEPSDLEEMLRTLPIPPNLNVEADIKLGQVIFRKLKADSVKGNITIGQGSMKLTDLKIRAYGGDLTGKTALNISEREDITYDGSFRLDKLDAGMFLSSFFGIREDIFGGTLSCSLSFNGAGLDSSSITKNLSALGSFSMENGRVSNWEFTRKLGKSIKFLDFDILGFDRIHTSFKAVDGRVITDDLRANTEYGIFSLSGSTGFDTSVDYNIVFKLNKKAVSIAEKNKLGFLAELIEDDSETPVLNIKAVGSLKSPSFKIDTSQAKKKAKERLIKEVEKLIDREAEKLIGNKKEELKKEGRKLLKKIFK